MKQVLYRLFFTCVLVAGWSLSSPAQLLCQNIFQYKAAEKVLTSKGSNFAEFEELKSNYRTQLTNKTWQDVGQIKTEVQKITFLEAYGDVSQNDFFMWMKYHSENKTKSKEFLDLVTKMNLTQPMSHFEMENLLEKLYAISNPAPSFLRRLMGPRTQELIRNRIDYEITKNDFYSLLTNLGLVRNPTMLEKLRSMLKDFQPYGQFIRLAVLNCFSLHFVGAPYLLTKPDFINQLPARIRLETTPTGETAVQGEENLTLAARTDVGFARFRRIFFGVLAASMLSHLSLSDFTYQQIMSDANDVWSTSVGSYDMLFKKEAKIDMNLLNETMDTQIYLVWAEAYEKAHHQTPDPIHHFVDRAQWIYFLVNLPDPNS
jgi:hypothetical protein